MSCPMGFTAGKKPLDTAEDKTQSDGQGFGFTSAGAIRPSADTVAHDDQSDRPVKPKRGKEPLYYHDYLELDRVLDSQHPKSAQPDGRMAHEEMLFIVIHQTYELWFKQILHDVKSCLRIFNREYVPERALGIVVRRLNRVTRIQKVLIDQMGILETMTPLDFLDFRDYLFPASGFQSVQFRVLENSLGLPREQRLKYARADYTAALRPEHKAMVEEAENGPTLYTVVESWLERTPFLEDKDFNFWSAYEAAVKRMFQADREEAEADPDLSPDERRTRVESINDSEQQFSRIFNEADYNALLASGQRRLSYRATKAAILISLYRDEPIFQLPQQLLTLLLDMDENLVAWRNTHASMVHRMLGLKLGTGGSSGYHYLRATAAHHKIFDDFFNLSMFLIPRSALPVLPEHIVQRLRFHYKAQAVGREQARTDAAHSTGTDDDTSDLEAAPTPKAPPKAPIQIAQAAQATAAK